MGFSAHRIADILLYVYRWLSFGFTFSMLYLDILHPLLLALLKLKCLSFFLALVTAVVMVSVLDGLIRTESL